MSGSHEPPVFRQVLQLIFRKSDEAEGERAEPSETERSRAVQAYRLLNSWQTLPGTRSDGTVDEKQLLDWVRAGQELADKEGRREVCDTRFGHVLAYAPKELADGSWPSVSVRDVIEEVGTEAMMEGFVVGVLNKPPAHWRPSKGGGEPERSLAAEFFAWADTAKIEWPKRQRRFGS